jgi:hypothetical protein
MSGPKVVRVVTREEVLAICHGRMEAVREAVEEWRRCAKRHDALSAEVAADVEGRYQALAQLFAREMWLDVQKRAPEVIAFLHHDMERIREAAIHAAAQARATRRRFVQSAHTIAAALQAAGQRVPDELVQAIRTAPMASDEELASLNSTLSRAMTSFTLMTGAPQTTQHQRELADRLSDSTPLQSVAQWLAGQDQALPQSDKERRLDRLLAEIEVIGDRGQMETFLQRAQAIDTERESARKALLIDALTIDVAAYCRQRVQTEQHLATMREACRELRQLASEQARLVEQHLQAAMTADDIAQAQALHAEALRLIAEETRARAAVARRAAVLKGLAELGYEVRETMATAWAHNGRIVVRKPAEAEFGIELSGAPAAERFQVRLVAFDQPGAIRDGSRDRDMETIWCNEFARLQALLEASGSALLIERALAAGATPVKIVEREPARDQIQTSAPTPKTRTLNPPR